MLIQNSLSEIFLTYSTLISYIKYNLKRNLSLFLQKLCGRLKVRIFVFTAFIFIFIELTASAQTSDSIKLQHTNKDICGYKGFVFALENKPLNSGFIRLINVSDSNLTYSTFSDLKGKFEFSTIICGTYNLTITRSGFDKFTKEINTSSFKNLPDTIKLSRPEVTTEEIEVKSDKPLFEF